MLEKVKLQEVKSKKMLFFLLICNKDLKGENKSMSIWFDEQEKNEKENVFVEESWLWEKMNDEKYERKEKETKI